MNTHRHWSPFWLAASLTFAFTACSDDSSAPLPASIVVSGNHSVEVGKTVTITPSTINGKDTAYTFKSADDKIATVDTAGVVTGVAAGETMIEVTGGDTKSVGSHAIVVITTGGGPTGEAVVTITGDTFVQIGATLKLTALTTNATDASYTWASDTEAVATVAADGTVTGVASGTAKITATGADSKKSATLTIMVTVDVPIIAEWRKSGHADSKAEAFRHWDTPTPPATVAEVPTSCAKCHAGAGFQDYLGADGSAEFVVDKAAAPSKAGIDCVTCHNEKAMTLSQVTFPSGVTVTGLGAEARCMTCHQGRESTVSVDKAITDAALADDDTISATLGFKNVHYFAAGATLFGGKVKGGYQYKGNTYDWRFRHAAGLDKCTGCHDPHSLEVRLDVCKTCHTGITTKADLKKIRMIDSMADYDGDGKTDGGVYDELVGLRTKLLAAIQGYASEKGTKICYAAARHPYFFKDTDGNGTCEATETAKYDAFTPRLLRATFNYQVSMKDPGAFAHNAKYIIQLLFDSITDLNTKLTTKIDLTKAVRDDVGHFNGAGEPARHWDANDAVASGCSKCHGGSEGLVYFLQFGVEKGGVEQDNGLDCATCHTKLGTWTELRAVDSVAFPSGKKVELVAKGNISNACGTCHAGRESKSTVDAAIASGKPSFRNVHYLPAAAILAGSTAAVGYEYTGKTYLGLTSHAVKDCSKCHDAKLSNHTFQIKDVFAAGCGASCHAGVTDYETLKFTSRATVDYDGSGTVETLKKEHAGMAAKLLAAMQVAAAATKICYNGDAYPYWFIDTNGDGTCDAAESVNANSYKAWTAPLAKAAFNYQLWKKEPGAWAHNFGYLGQLLFDAIEDVGGATTGMTRPIK